MSQQLAATTQTEIQELIRKNGSLEAEFYEKTAMVIHGGAVAFEGAIDSQEMYEAALTYRKDIRATDKDWDAEMKRVTAPLNQVLELEYEKFREPRRLLKQAISVIDTQVNSYLRLQEKMRIDRQRQADEAARKERERLAAEAREKAEALRKAEMEAEARRQEAERVRLAAEAEMEAKATAQLAEGRDHALVKIPPEAMVTTEQVIEAQTEALQLAAMRAEVEQAEMAAMTVAPTIVANTTKVAGSSSRKVWKWRVVNPAEVPRDMLMLDEKKISGHVRTYGADKPLSGIEIYEEFQIASRTSARSKARA